MPAALTRRCAPAALALAALNGCTLWGYPTSAAEVGALCANDVDDDLDGFFDCEDRGCASTQCLERTEAQCQNGWDDDDDGWSDGQDLGCLPFGRLEVRRCVPVGPADFAPTFGSPDAPVVDSGWRVIGEPPSIEPDAVDPLHLVARSGETGTTLESDAFAGALVGLTLHFELVAPLGTLTSIGLVVDGDFGSAIPDGIQVLVDEAGGVALVGSGFAVFGFPAAAPGPERHVEGTLGVVEHELDGELGPPRVTAALTIDGRPVMFDAPRATPFPGRPAGAVPRAMADGVPLRVRFLAAGPGATLVSASAHLDAYDDCIDDGSAADSPVLPAHLLGLARSPERVCAIMAEGSGLPRPPRTVAVRSTDGGLHWDAPAEVLDASALGPPTLGATDVALTWSGTEFVGVAALTDGPDGRIVATRLVRSPDCLTWEIAPSGLDDALPTSIGEHFVTYGVGDIDGAPDTHEITFVSLGAGTNATLLRATSEDGAPGSFRFVPEAVELPQPARWNLHLFNGLRVQRVGTDRVLLYADPDGLRAYVEEPLGLWTEIPSPLYAPSGIVGSLDESTILFPLLVFDAPAEPGEPLRGVLAHSGSTVIGTCPECDLATVVEPFEIVRR